MPTIMELETLLQFPIEKLTVEYKTWLNLSENPGRASLAKAAIALANEGGGVIVLGMREDNAQGRILRSQARPSELERYSQDEINASINRYADPEFHCELAFANDPGTNNEHAFVLVPGGMTVPIMSTRGCEGVIAAQRCYVRKPGPRSEEPFTADEWRGVMERCIAARRESMLDAIRIIVQGSGGPLESPAEQTGKLAEFERDALERWNTLINDLPADDDARMIHGRYEVAFEVLNAGLVPSAGELRRRMVLASQVRHTGWGPFVQIPRGELEPRIVNGNVEAWLGRAAPNRVMRDPAHCDYWCANPSGLFFLLRGYEEDASGTVEPERITDITLPIWRVGETLLYASRIARSYGANPQVAVRCHYRGLRNRRLGALNPIGSLYLNGTGVCHDADVELGTISTAAELDDNLIEILHPLLVPLYERFSFFELPIDLVRTEVTRMRGSRF